MGEPAAGEPASRGKGTDGLRVAIWKVSADGTVEGVPVKSLMMSVTDSVAGCGGTVKAGLTLELTPV